MLPMLHMPYACAKVYVVMAMLLLLVISNAIILTIGLLLPIVVITFMGPLLLSLAIMRS